MTNSIHPDDPGEPILGSPRIPIAPDEEGLLTVLARGHVVLEIGTGLGVSTRALCKLARVVVTHDIDPWTSQFAGYAPAVWFRERSAIPRLPYTFCFIDGGHSENQVREDVALAVRSMSPNGLIVLHDAKALTFLRGVCEEYGRYYELDTTHGLGLLVVQEEDEKD